MALGRDWARVGRPLVANEMQLRFSSFSGNGGVGRGPPTFLTSALPWSLLPSRGWLQVNRVREGEVGGLLGAGWVFILAPGSLPGPL